MCVHPKPDSNKDTSDMNKITDDLNKTYNCMDSLSEFSGFCPYIDLTQDLQHSASDLKVTHWNICSILSKLDELAGLLNNNAIDICTVNETWLKKTNHTLVKLADNSFESCERTGTMKRGGVGILVSHRFNYIRRFDLEKESHDLELCALELNGLEKIL